MRKNLHTFFMFAYIASATTFGSHIVFADDAVTTPTPVQGHILNNIYASQYLKSLAKQLGFSDQQNAQLMTILSTNQTQATALTVSRLTAYNGLRSLIQSGTADETAINAQSATLAAAEASLAVQQAQVYKQFLALLTTTQVTTLNSIQAAQQAKFQQLITNISNSSQQ
jgi:Spy/CpxP family protein refolding chaperone